MSNLSHTNRQLRVLAALGLMIAAVLVGYSAFSTPPLSVTAEPQITRYVTVNVNTADEAEWMQLPGITLEQVRSILHYRSQIGRFGCVSDLKQVAGLDADDIKRWEPYLDFT